MLRLVRSLAVAATAFVLLAAGPASASPAAKLDEALRHAPSGARQRVIVRVQAGRRAQVRQAARSLGLVVAEHPSIEALTVETTPQGWAKLAARADVESVGLDADVTSAATPGRVKKGSALQHTSVLRETLGLTALSPRGDGVGVALIDSGIAPLPAFANRITAFYDFTDGTFAPTPPFDPYGHGTHVAGLVGAQQLAGDFEYEGVAPAVHFVGVKVLDKNGKGRTSDVIRAIEFVTANKTLFNVQIVNLSLGHPILAAASADPLVQAVERAVRAGLIVVVSAGNFGTNPETGEIGYAGITSPGNAPSAITVGAVDTKQTAPHGDDEVTRYSSRGPTWYDAFAKPDVVAPGHSLIAAADVESYLYRKYPSLRRQGSGRRTYLELSGTSMAAGVASGVVATMLDANRLAHPAAPRLTANAVKALLQYTAIDVNGSGKMTRADALTQGTGAVNAEGALRLAWLVNTAAAPNTAWLDLHTPLALPYTTIAGETTPWAATILWGENILWGESVAVNTMAWADNIVWGMDDNIVWGMATSWGDNIVWSLTDNIVWGENIVWGDGLLSALNGDNIVWGMVSRADNIVWGELSEDNIVWGMDDDNIVWGMEDDNVVWGMDNLAFARSSNGGLR